MKPTKVGLPADVHQIDATGHVWTYLDEAPDPQSIVPGEIIVAGDETDPFVARVVDIVPGTSGRPIVHLDVSTEFNDREGLRRRRRADR